MFGGDYDPIRGVRSGELISAAVSRSGRAVAVWAECGLRASCDANDVVLTESADGVAWSPRRRLPTQTTGTAFMPVVDVDPASGRIGVVYHRATGCARGCVVDAWLIESPDGRRWTRPIRLSAQSMQLPWMARATGGAMLGDYVGLSYVGGRPVAVLAFAQKPVDGRLSQAIFAVTSVAAPLRRAR